MYEPANSSSLTLLALTLLGATNSGHTSMLRSAQIRQSRTSYVRKTLSAIASAYNGGV
jgi:hypothetical protein